MRWSSHLLRAFYREGVRHVWISPGSRSTPLVLAAAIHPGFAKHVVLDERSAGFQALGCGKSSGVPALLICTSGTALANYHPAVIEARQAGVPMIVLSADRPPHLRATGSSQTIDQIKLFGDSVLFFHELGEPAGAQEDLNRLDLLARQAVEISIRRAGPIHLNAPFRKPLEPEADTLKRETRLAEEQACEPPAATGRIRLTGRAELPEPVIRQIEASARPLLIAGTDEPCRAGIQLAETLANQKRIPLLAEPGSALPGRLNTINRYDMLLGQGNVPDSIAPDLILKLGNLPFSRSLMNLVKNRPEIPVIQFLTRESWQQGEEQMGHQIRIDGYEPNFDGLTPKPTEWGEQWRHLDQRAEQVLDKHLADAKELTDGHVCNHLSRLLTGEWNLMLSNSWTIRDLALFRPGKPLQHHVATNRGAAGIDGIVSTAIGLQQESNRRTAVLVGDLAMLHDSNALLSLKKSDPGLLILVVNNGGGTIFRMLPVYKVAREYYKPYFETPQEADLAGLAAAHGLAHRTMTSLDQLQSLEELPDPSEGSVLLEFRTDAESTMKLRRKLWRFMESDGTGTAFDP